MGYTLVNDCAQIDLTRHAIIEASAGTGKTYTLENLVVRLLRERPDIALENILMVTFTEKATSELKIRIREKLEQEITPPAGAENSGAPVQQIKAAQKIKDTLDAIDTASIYTIHGFCHTVLKDFAFENGSLFQNEVVEDLPVFDTLIREQMRKNWPQVYGVNLPEILGIAGFGAQKDKFVSLVVNIAMRVYRPGVGDEIKPDVAGKTFDQMRSGIITQVMDLKTLMAAPPGFSEGFKQLNINPRSKKSLMEKIVIPLETFLSQTDATRFSMRELLELIKEIQAVKSSGRQGIECLVPEKWLKSGDNRHVCPRLEGVVERLAGLAETLATLACFLAIDAVKQLQTDAARLKRRNGWISYDDMLSQVDSALHGEHSARLINTLRARYRVAFVDEFQDTDPIQWRIFKRLFLDHPQGAPGNLLVLIGDPKQAIYSFRGADVYAYLEARNQMERLSRNGAANLYSLATNWRTTPELVGAFNGLFARDEWFPAQDRAGAFEIGYQKVGSPEDGDLPAVLAVDHSRRPALNIVDLSGEKSPGPAKPVLARFIADEIRCLIDGGGMEIRAKNGDSRALDFGDICILVRGRKDALVVEPELAARGIPYSFYKKPGLFLSDEALYLSLLCHAILDPGSIPNLKKALLTPFFAISSTALYAVENLSVSHPLKQLMFRWHDLARSGKWGALFQSLLEDSGLLFREAESRDWDRKYTNYRQMFEHLEASAYRKNLDFRGLSALLDSYRKQTLSASEDADIHQIETEARKVQIMTLHVSKGLQFPVVFIAGGLTQPSGDDYHVYHACDPGEPGAGAHKIIDLSRSYNQEKHQQEKVDEDKRLYYVGLTRAQFKAYAPFFPATSEHRWIGPVCRFFASAISSAFPRSDSNPAIGWISPVSPGAMAQGGVGGRDNKAVSGDRVEKVHPLLPTNPNYQFRKIMLESFSSLHEGRYPGPGQPPPQTGFQVEQDKDKEDDESFAPLGLDGPRPAPPDDEIPGGTDTGSMFHDILEHIDFEKAALNPEKLLEITETRRVIVNAMDAHRLDERWRPEVCRMIANVLTTPVSIDQDAFVLGDLKRGDRIHEVEFCYPFDFPVRGKFQIPDCEIERGRRGFIRGFIDFVFRRNGKYFIADWKSNRLDSGYARESLEASMKESGYHLQYKLYTVAVLRWLKRALGDRFSTGSHFGGVFYFYLRGMGTGDGNGIYFVSPAGMGALERLESEIADRVKGAV